MSLTDITVSVELRGSTAEDHPIGHIWITDLDCSQANCGSVAHPIFWIEARDLTPEEAMQYALAGIVFATVPAEQIVHNDWQQYLPGLLTATLAGTTRSEAYGIEPDALMLI